MEFAYYFHYCKNLKFEDRPDYATLKCLFYDLLMQQSSVNSISPEFTFDWFVDANDEEQVKDRDDNLFGNTNIISLNKPKNKFATGFQKEHRIAETPDDNKEKDIINLIDFKDVKKNFNNNEVKDKDTPGADHQNPSNLSGRDQNVYGKDKNHFSFNKNDFLNSHIIKKPEGELLNAKVKDGVEISKTSFSNSGSSASDTERLGNDKHHNEDEIKKIINCKIYL